MKKIIDVILTCFIIPLLFLSVAPVGILNNYPWVTYLLLGVCILVLIVINYPFNKVIRKNIKYEVESMPITKYSLRGRGEESNYFSFLVEKKNNPQLIYVKGEFGIGKTSLVSSYIARNKRNHDLIIWQPLSDMPTTREIINSWLSIYSETIPELALSARIDAFIRQIKKNKHKNVLIVFDNVESLIKIDSTHVMKFSDEFVLLLKRLVHISDIQIKLVLTTAVDLENILPPVGSTEVIELNKLNKNVLQKIIVDRTSKELSLDDISMACGNPSAALLLAGIEGDDNKSTIIARDERNTLVPLVDKRLQMLSPDEQLLVLFLSIIRFPLTIRELQNLWRLVPPYGALNSNEVEKLRKVYVVDLLANNKILINPIVAEVMMERIVDDLVAALVGNEILSTSLIHCFPLDYARFSDKVRANTKLHIFPDACKKMQKRYSVSISQVNAETVISNLINFKFDGEYDFLFSNIVMFLLFCKKDLSNLIFPSAKLYGVDFSRTHMFNMDLSNVQLNECIFADRNGSAYATSFMGKQFILVGLASGSIELRNVDDLKRIKRIEAHYEPVRAVYYSSKYEHILSAGEDGRVVIYDKTLEIIQSFKAHLRWIWRIVEITERYVISVACDNTVGLIDLETNKLLYKIPVSSQRIWDAAILGNEVYLVTEEGIIWKKPISEILNQSTNEWKVVTVVSVPIKACCVCLNILIFGCRDGSLYEINSQGENILLSKETGCIRDLCTIPDSNKVISVGDTGSANIYEITNKFCVSEKKVQSSRTWQIDVYGSMAVTVGDDRTVHLWDVDDLSSIKISSGNGQSLRSIDVFNENYIFACADDFLRFADDEGIYPWISMTSRKRILGFVGLENKKWACSFDDGKIVFGQNQEIRFIRQEHANAIESIARNINGTLFATGGEDRVIKIFDSNGELMLSPKPLHNSRIWALSFSNDSKMLASAGGDFIIAIWRVDNGQMIANCVGHNNLILAVCWLNDRKLVSAGTDGTIRLWDAISGNPLLIKPISGVIRGLTTDGKNNIYGVGRVMGETAGWYIIKWDISTNTVKTNLFSDLGGSARAIIFKNNRLMVGGDMPFWIQVCPDSLNIISEQRIPGIYSGTKIKQENLKGDDCETLKLLGVDIL